jgi:methylphosphotriester-DNA--protein-cysteine methyltransferase
VVASKSGTKYHLPTCPGAKQIKSTNLITFNSKQEAEAAGYTPASNCPGL